MRKAEWKYVIDLIAVEWDDDDDVDIDDHDDDECVHDKNAILFLHNKKYFKIKFVPDWMWRNEVKSIFFHFWFHNFYSQ